MGTSPLKLPTVVLVFHHTAPCRGRIGPNRSDRKRLITRRIADADFPTAVGRVDQRLLLSNSARTQGSVRTLRVPKFKHRRRSWSPASEAGCPIKGTPPPFTGPLGTDRGVFQYCRERSIIRPIDGADGRLNGPTGDADRRERSRQARIATLGCRRR